MEAAKLSKDMETMSRERLQMRGAPFFPLPPRQEDRRRIENASSKINSIRTKERHLSNPDVGSSSKKELSRPTSAMGCRHGRSVLSPKKTMTKTQTFTHRSSTTMLNQSRKDSSPNKRKHSAPVTLRVSPKSKSDYSHIQSKIDSGRRISIENTAKKKLSCGPVLQHCRVSTSFSGAGSETKCCNLSVNSRELKRIRSEATSRIDSRNPFPQVHRMTHAWTDLTETESFLFNIRFLLQPNLMASLFRRHNSFSECATVATLERKKAVLLVSSHRKWKSMEDLHVRLNEHLEGDLRLVSMTTPTQISRKQMFGEEILGKISNEGMFTDAERHFLVVSESESDEEATDHEYLTGSSFVGHQGQPSITADLGALSRGDPKATTKEQNLFTPPTNEKGLMTPPKYERWSLITPPTYKSQGRKVSPTKQKQDIQTKHSQRKTSTVCSTTTCGTNKKDRSTKQQLPLSLRRYSNV